MILILIIPNLISHRYSIIRRTLIYFNITGEFVHPNVIYSMEIDANMRRLSVGAALSEAGSK